jgi:hypothetical protein
MTLNDILPRNTAMPVIKPDAWHYCVTLYVFELAYSLVRAPGQSKYRNFESKRIPMGSG